MPVWRYFPAIYALPFMFATTQFPPLVAVSELARWAVMLVAFWVAMRFRFRRGGYKNAIALRTDLFLAIAFAFFMLSSIWSIDTGYSLQKSLSMLLLIVTSFWAFWRYADRYSEKQLLDRILFSVIAVLTANITLGWFLGDPMLLGRFRGFFVNPNNIGILASVAGSLILVRWLRQMTWNSFLALGIVMANLVLAGSRSALLGIGLVLVLSMGRTLLAKPLHGILFVSALVVAALVFTQTDFFVQRILREETLTDASNRVYFWALAKDYISNRWLLGHGFGTDIIIHGHYGIVLRDQGLRGAGVMSSYYGLAVQVGVPLTLAFFGLVWGYVLFVLLTRIQHFWSYSYAAILAGGLVLAVFEPVMFSAGNAFSFLYTTVFMLLVRREAYRRRGMPLGEDGQVIAVKSGPTRGRLPG